MELSETELDEVAIEQGIWVDNIPNFGDVRLRVRGQYNSDWRRRGGQLSGEVPPSKRIGGNPNPDEAQKILNTLLVETSLLEWDRLTENGKPIPYSKELAEKYIFERRKFRDAVFYAASYVGQLTAATNGNAAGNSGGGSNGI